MLLFPMASAPKTSPSRLVRFWATTRIANLAPISDGIHERPEHTARIHPSNSSFGQHLNRYAKGLRKQSAETIANSREKCGSFGSAEDLVARVSSLNRKELTLSARVGALNNLDGIEHRRNALWQVERAGKLEGPLLRQRSEILREEFGSLPLQQMNTEERLIADYAGTGLTNR
jgi:hypothetical protein